MNKIFYIVLISILLVSCSTSQPIAETASAPAWVTSRPQSSENYIGIGFSSKKGSTPDAYRTTAKQEALTDLSSEISITIESSSVLNSMQVNQNFSQQFVNDIKTNNSLQLEGYELVDTYETENQYWVYYRLSKTDYQNRKLQKKQYAVETAKNKYLQAEKLLQDQLHYNAFQLYAEALSALSAYLNESTPCLLNDREADLGNTIYNAMVQFFNESKFSISSPTMMVKKGVDLPLNAFCFTLQDGLQHPMVNMPIKVSFTGNGLMKNSEKTDVQGQICCSLPKIKTQNSQETLSLSVDVVALSRIVTDHLVRNIIKNIPIVEMPVRIMITKPVMRIIGDEQQLNSRTSDNLLQNHFANHLRSAFDISDHDADFTLTIQCNTYPKERFQQLDYVVLECNIIITDNKEQPIYRKRIKEEFSGKTQQEASNNGYQNVIQLFDRTLRYDLESSIL
ncbi:MAG: LPP20 family lipoprotein [Bacteroidales bacterium]|nr:LPP20 family lipoprotein [Bacteroidales bacterium]